MTKVTNEKVIEYRSKVINGIWKWQFGNDQTAIVVRAIVDNGENWTQHTVRFFDGYQDPDHRLVFEMTVNEFANYLAKNEARKHWTVGA